VPHWTNQTHRSRAQNAASRAQQLGSELWSPVRDEEAAGSNPVTPTSEQVNVHDFPDKELGKAIPYGINDVSANTGWVSVGTDHDTSAFAVATLRTWWETIGRARYPGASRLLICADGGGSNGSRVRAWKIELAAFAADTGLRVTVAHLPPGTSKWNKIEHRLFSQITLNWPGRPLTSHQVIVDLIANTSTATGLSVRRPGHRPVPDRHQLQRQRHRRATPGPTRLPRRLELHPAASRHAIATGLYFFASPRLEPARYPCGSRIWIAVARL
jgi:hypothetical protein